jgi:hypothetical protein
MSREISQLKDDVSKQYHTNDSLLQEIHQVREQNTKQLKMIETLSRENRNLQNSFSSSSEKSLVTILLPQRKTENHQRLNLKILKLFMLSNQKSRNLKQWKTN